MEGTQHTFLHLMGQLLYHPLMQIGDFTIMVLSCKIQFGKHSSIIYTSTVQLF